MERIIWGYLVSIRWEVLDTEIPHYLKSGSLGEKSPQHSWWHELKNEGYVVGEKL